MSKIAKGLLLGLFLCSIIILVIYDNLGPISRAIMVVRSSLLNEGHVLFHVSYSHDGWRLGSGGFYIDSEGRVFRFDGGGGCEPTSSELVGTIDSHTLTEMAGLIQPASLGEVSESHSPTLDICEFAGRGTTFFSANFYQNLGMTQKAVLLAVTGRMEYVNSAEEARALHEWLETIYCSEWILRELPP